MPKVHYNNSDGVVRGGIVGKESTVCLTPGEWITEIEGTVSNNAISKLSFVTSKGMQLGVIADGRYSCLATRYQMGTVWQSVACLHVSLEPIWAAYGIAVLHWEHVRIPPTPQVFLSKLLCQR